jgi:hypothetical protein
MVIRLSDLTEEAQRIGVWSALCEVAGIEPDYDKDQEINITKIEGEE